MTSTSLHLLPRWPHQKPQLEVWQLPQPLTHSLCTSSGGALLADPTHLARLPHLTAKEMETQKGGLLMLPSEPVVGPGHPYLSGTQPLRVSLWKKPVWKSGPGGEPGRQTPKGATKPGCRPAVGSHPSGQVGLCLYHLILPPPRSVLCIQWVMRNVGCTEYNGWQEVGALYIFDNE